MMRIKDVKDFTIPNDCKVIATDIDGTLVFHKGPDPGIPSGGGFVANIDLLSELVEWASGNENHDWIVWSGQGKLYAQAMCRALGISEIVAFVTGKPTAIYEDNVGWFDDCTTMVKVVLRDSPETL